MRDVIVTEFISADGVIEDPGGAEDFAHGGWSMKFNAPEGMELKLNEALEAGALLLGRRTYEGFAAAWPGRTDEVGFAAKMNAMPKYVVSATLTDPAWENTTVIDGDVAERVAALKGEDGGPLLVAGSAQLAQTLRDHDLVDEYRLMIAPIVLGSGKRLFGDTGKADTLQLTESRALSSGALWVTYRTTR